MFQAPKTVEYQVVPRKLPEVRLANLRPMHDRILCQRLPMPDGAWLGNMGQEHLEISAYASSKVIESPEIVAKTECIGSFLRTNGKSCRGVVLRVGPGKRDEDGRRRPCEAETGDVVWWGPYIDLEDGDLVLISEQDIRCFE